MVSAFSFLLLLCSAALGAVVPRTNTVPDGYCCFQLTDTTTGKVVQQDPYEGILYFDFNKPKGWYCMDHSDDRDVLWDGSWNACIMSLSGFFQCLDGTLGLNVWTLKHSGSKLLITHDDISDYKACPNNGGGEIVDDTSATGSGCRTIQLAATGLKGTCSGYTS